MKSFIFAVAATVLSAGVAAAAVGDEVCIKTGSGAVICGTVVIQR